MPRKLVIYVINIQPPKQPNMRIEVTVKRVGGIQKRFPFGDLECVQVEEGITDEDLSGLGVLWSQMLAASI